MPRNSNVDNTYVMENIRRGNGDDVLGATGLDERRFITVGELQDSIDSMDSVKDVLSSLEAFKSKEYHEYFENYGPVNISSETRELEGVLHDILNAPEKVKWQQSGSGDLTATIEGIDGTPYTKNISLLLQEADLSHISFSESEKAMFGDYLNRGSGHCKTRELISLEGLSSGAKSALERHLSDGNEQCDIKEFARTNSFLSSDKDIVTNFSRRGSPWHPLHPTEMTALTDDSYFRSNVSDQSLDNLSFAEMAAINIYTQNYYREMNSTLRGAMRLSTTRDDADREMTANILCTAMATHGLKAMKCTKVQYGVRGEDIFSQAVHAERMQACESGRITDEDGFISSSNEGLQPLFESEVTIMYHDVYGVDVKNLSYFPNEAEYLIMPGTQVRWEAHGVDSNDGNDTPRTYFIARNVTTPEQVFVVKPYDEIFDSLIIALGKLADEVEDAQEDLRDIINKIAVVIMNENINSEQKCELLDGFLNEAISAITLKAESQNNIHLVRLCTLIESIDREVMPNIVQELVRRNVSDAGARDALDELTSQEGGGSSFSTGNEREDNENSSFMKGMSYRDEQPSLDEAAARAEVKTEALARPSVGAESINKPNEIEPVKNSVPKRSN